MSNENAASVKEGGSKIAWRYKIIGLVFIVMILMLAVRLLSSLSQNKSSSAVQVKETKLTETAQESDLRYSPDELPDVLMQEKVDEKHRETVENEAGHDKSVVKTSPESTQITPGTSPTDDINERLKRMGLTTYVPPSTQEVDEPTPVRREPQQRQRQGEGETNPYVADLRNLYALWDSPVQASSGVNLAIPVKHEQFTQANNPINEAQRSNDELSERGVKFLRVYSGTLELGYNSDTGGLMVVSVHLPGLRDVKFQAVTQVGAYNERAAIELTRAVTDDGEVFDVKGVVIDQKDRIPSITGKVDRHILYNTIYGFGTAFLDAYAQYRTIDAGAGLSLPLISTDGTNSVDTDGVLAGNAASAVSRSIKQLGEFRPNTLTTKAFTTVGVVFLPEDN